ncbi:MAG: hypothetical protein HGA44_00575, partial [Cellulomonadaceae bacterium]|nr:hypothetical protein [Cellulomonadaceae bacterium]
MSATTAPSTTPGATFLPAPDLPKGGLAAHGLGEHLDIDEHTGTLTLSVAVATTPGRGASTAPLTLTYTSGAGRSVIGHGWSLPVPSVRRGSDRSPTYSDLDTFSVAGLDDLVPTRDGAGAVVEHPEVIDGVAHTVRSYRPRTDDTRTRVERCTPSTGSAPFWRTIDADDVLRTFGRSPTSRVADPTDATRVHEWLLDEVRDDRGNVAVYTWVAEDTVNVVPSPGEAHRLRPGAPSQPGRYLASVRYGNAVAGDGSTGRFLVVLDYGAHDLTPVAPSPWPVRPDPYSSSAAGFEVRTWRRCRRILLFHDFGADLGPGPSPRLVRSVELTHDALSRVLRIRQVGHRWQGGAYASASFAPLDLTYTDAVMAETSHELVRSGGAVDAPSLVDLDRDGMPGLLTTTANAWWYRRPAGGGTFERPVLVAELPGGVLDARGLQDVDGSGRLASVVATDASAGSCIREGNHWDRFRPVRGRAAAHAAAATRADADLDGRADLVTRGPDAVRWTHSNGRDGDGRTSVVPATPRGPHPPTDDEPGCWTSADLDGDGLPDLVHVGPSLVEYWPNLGRGRYGERVVMTGTPRFAEPDLFDAHRVRFADLDGTGCADVLYLGGGDVTWWRNSTGTSWGAAQVLARLPRTHDLADVQVTDLLGLGTPCLVWLSSAPTGAQGRYRELAVDGRPHLLRSVTNNLGARTLIDYESSAQQALRARQAGRPWRTPPGSPTTVVALVQEHDDVAGTHHATRYTYRDPWTDPAERTARGFAWAQALDVPATGAGPLDRPAVRRETWFAVGRPDETVDGTWDADPGAVVPGRHVLDAADGLEHAQAARAFAGRAVHSETWVDDGGPAVPVLVSRTRWRIRRLQPATDSDAAVFRVEPLEVVEAHHERVAHDPRVTHELTLAVDDRGTPTSTVRLAYPRRAPQIAEQAVVLAGWTRTVTSTVDTAASHRVSVPVDIREDEVVGLTVPVGGRFEPDALAALLAAAPELGATAAPAPGVVQHRLHSRTRYEFWDDALGAGLPAGQVGHRALVRRVLRLAMTDQLVADVLGTIAPAALLSGEGGYAHADGAWWTTDGVRRYDQAACFEPSALTSPWGTTAEVTYDAHHLAVVRSRASQTPPLDLLTTTFEHDYATMSPRAVVDPDGIRRRATFDALGRVDATWRTAPDATGDPDALPGAVFAYDALSWFAGTGPAWAATTTRSVHADATAPTRVQRMYTDGAGRVALTSTAVEPGEAWADDGAGGIVLVDTTPAPRWLGSGRTVFDSAGQPVEQYEPYVGVAPTYESTAALAKRTVLQRRTYDALSRLVRVDHPDGTFETTQIGPWSQVQSDRNDTVVTSQWFAERQAGGAATAAEQRAATLAAAHAGTPLESLCDGLGRVVRTRHDVGPDGVLETRTVLDLTGETVAVVDPRGLLVVDQVRDAAGRVLRTRSPEAGTQVALADSAGRALRLLTADGTLVSYAYDALGRPTTTRVRPAGGASERVASLTVYGEGHPQAVALRLVGRVHRRYDDAGVAIARRYDLGGNLVEGERRTLLGTAPPDWSPAVGVPVAGLDAATGALLDPGSYLATSSFDALGRATLQVLPDGTRMTFGYHGGGELRTVSVQPAGVGPSTAVVVDQQYDARRRRTDVVHGNGVHAHHLYDAGSGRPVGLTATVGATTLQDLTYTWDPVGNVVEVADHTASAVFFAGAVATPGSRFTFDAAYRLRTATGREHASLGTQPDGRDPAMPGLPHPNDPNALRPYTETYAYDAAGNITSLAHASTSNPWTRRYAYAASSNRLLAHQVPGDNDAGPFSATFDHDAAGRITRMPHVQQLAWDHTGRLVSTDLGGGGVVSLQHDGGGTRVRKVWQSTGAVREERLYVGALEIFRRYRSGVLELERHTVRVEGGHGTDALIETLVVDTTQVMPDTTPRTRYQLGDLLGSSVVETDDAGAVISYEEYHPFGTTSLWLARGQAADSAKRYRYAGKEKDAETGCYVVGARYYAPWLGRWTSPDPAGLADGTNRYSYVGNNPVSRVDPLGLEGEPPSGLQMWFSEAKAFWIDARATQSGRGFLESGKKALGHRDVLQKLVDLWGGPESWDIGHKEDPFGVQRPGQVSKVGVEDSGWNRSKGATADKAVKADRSAAGNMVRDAEGRWPVKVEVKGKPPAVPQDLGGIKPGTPPSTAVPKVAAPPAPPATTAVPKLSGPPGEQLKLPGVQTESQLNLFDQRPAAPRVDVAPKAPAGPPAEQLPLFKEPVPSGPGSAGAPPSVAKAADITQDATKATELAKDASTTVDVTKDAAKAADVTKDVATAADVTKDAGKVAEVTKDAAAIKNLAPVVKDGEAAADVAKSVAPVVKTVTPAVKEAGALTRTLESAAVLGSKVVKVAAPVVKVAAPVVRVIGEVAKPLAVGVAAVDLATANNNTDRLVAAGDLTAGVAMYCGPVGEAFALGYTVGGLADKGIEKASKSLVGVDLSPSNGLSHVMDAQDKIISAVIP